MELVDSILFKKWHKDLVKSKRLKKFRQYFNIDYDKNIILIKPKTNISDVYLYKVDKIVIKSYSVFYNIKKDTASFGDLCLNVHDSKEQVINMSNVKTLIQAKDFLKNITDKFPTYDVVEKKSF